MSVPERSNLPPMGATEFAIEKAFRHYGFALGLLIGWLLIDVINVQSFGWTLLWKVPVGHLVVLGASLTIVGFACGAAAGAWWFRKHQALKS